MKKKKREYIKPEFKSDPAVAEGMGGSGGTTGGGSDTCARVSPPACTSPGTKMKTTNMQS